MTFPYDWYAVPSIDSTTGKKTPYEVDPEQTFLRFGQAARAEGSASGVAVIGLRLV